nr:MAG TPA: histidine kinase-like protein [Caudoviricetes sp.]
MLSRFIVVCFFAFYGSGPSSPMALPRRRRSTHEIKNPLRK